ncbi:PREDICTED: protocadherin Fat 4-like [Amphimedon queenslandica]|uniref:Cadherin domain-containing protein n=1 Tax=Amphimedon queenslandica TaxID=400682 RepID=A0A1X7VPS8_AMPQE|nr:PREDICTED: protocadherin Fat 4-like [Amphimedon queenslandica]|eukprot:XP_011407489.2 PREDICTED: protocadherin Fat 4-like [Amphimedon queenslandica]
MATQVARGKLVFAAALLCLLLQTSPAHGQNNNLRPYFIETDISYTVLEDFNTTFPINSDNPLEAIDQENDNITYYIPDGINGYLDFEILTSGGLGYLYFQDSVSLDRESRATYNVRVFASDGQYHGSATDHHVDIIVRLRDVNDNTPVITNLEHTIVVSEATTANTPLFTVTATDADTIQNAIVAFRIFAVSPSSGSNKFSLVSSSGELSLAQTLDYEQVKQYLITIEAYDLGDPPRDSTKVLTVNVTDVNDNPPSFGQSTYAVSIYENTTKDTFVLSVSAMDIDTMINDKIVYSFNPSPPLINGVPSFVINDSTGDIFVNAPLDFEGNSTVYSLTVQASELNDPNMKTTVPVVITILDINDSPPKFQQQQYNNTISELTGIGADVLTVTASDADSGVNGQFNFELFNLLSTPLPFNITSTSDGAGTIQVNGLLDYEAYQFYRFQVLAVEVVNTMRKTGTTTVSISISNANDNDPIFTKEVYTASVPENADDEFVTQVMAVDNDLGSFGVVHYSLVDDYDVFEIANDTGRITTTDSIDYENVQSYSLTVVANDSAAPVSAQRSQKVSVIVSVLDQNDNGPVIRVNNSDTVTHVTANVSEGLQPGQLVFVVDATDADAYPHNVLSYYLLLLKPVNDTTEPFEYSTSASNQLVTNIVFDYEEVQQYTVRLYVTDYGHLLVDDDNDTLGSGTFTYSSITDIPSGHSDSIVVTVNVVDVNDEDPVFEYPEYNFNVTEELPNGSYVGTVKANDPDSGLFGKVGYSLSGIDHQNFSINSSSGVISTAGPIDRETKDRFDLIVTAYDNDQLDQHRSTTASLTILINDVNDNNPIFDQPIYYINDIFEDVTSVSIPVRATDRDTGTNKDIHYVIYEGNEDDTFTINSNTGVIGLNPAKELDRERIPQFHLTVQAIDGAPPPYNRTGNATVVIVLQDVDDNDPTFSMATYNVNLPEDTPTNSFVTVVTANDTDFGVNGLVRYELVPLTNPNFEIHEGTGVITSKRMFDYELEQRTYTLTIRAQDHNPSVGSPGYANVVIRILDVNDNSPLFSPSSYQASMPEDASSDDLIVKVRATDADSTSNSDISFEITDVQTVGSVTPTDAQADNLTDLFSVDPTTGDLYLSTDRSFDYESVQIYNVYIAAVDDGSPQMNSSTVVTVTITDINDNPPLLSHEVYNLTLSESTETGTLHNLYITYSDIDTGNNAAVDYEIEGTSSFTISPSTGVLTLESSLDFEDEQSLNFSLIITNKATPLLSDSATVLVYVTDANDNDPVFINGVGGTLTLSIPEGNYTHKQLFDFDATDADSGSYGNVSILITSSSAPGTFSIPDPSNGVLYVTGLLDREEEDTYTLTVTARDGGSPPRTDAVAITVDILDINELPPLFSVGSYSYNINENLSPMTLLTVSANDDDEGPNGTVRYSLSNDTYLSINEVTGVISSTGPYDYELVTNFTVNVTARDLGNLSSYVPLTVTINDINDNYPSFNEPSYGPYELSEDASTGHILVRVDANDPDSGPNGDISYVLENGGGRFSIDTSTGDISLISSLDREFDDFYALTVKAYDHGLIRLTSTVSLNVSVLDINDNSPEFLDTDIAIQNVNETAPNGTLIITLRSTDRDLDSNGTVSYSITSGNSLGLFGIDTVDSGSSYEGRLRVTGTLDYETLPLLYNLKVTASDNGPAGYQRSTSTNVVVSIININDNKPNFTQPSYVFSVSEVSGPSTSVGIVQANDGDSGVFGIIASYSFSSDTPADITSNFTLSSSSGLITVATGASLDYERRQDYNFTIIATDNGGLSSDPVNVSILIINYNDNEPVFNPSSYSESIYENITNGTNVLTVYATDPEGTDGISYSIVDGSFNKFTINPNTGVISTISTLDREETSAYVLRVQATDTGGSPLSGFTQVSITLLDVNDNHPLFDSYNLEYSLLETSELGTTLSNPVATATDTDTGDNGLISYFLAGEGIPSVFNINMTTGVISLQSSLDHELKENYTFTLYARDNGSPMSLYSDNVTVIVKVLDYNDHSPQLEYTIYNRTAPEDFSIGDLILNVTATDADEAGPNSNITFYISEVEGVASSDSPFAMNPFSGEITTTAALDYESRTEYTIIIRVQDSGVPIGITTGTVLLTITDVNDNYPSFTMSSYTHSLPEANASSTMKISILTVSATDADGTSPNNFVTYNITAGNSDDTFEINDTTGEVYAVKSLDYETTQSYTLTIMAKDNPLLANQTNVNETTVTINVNDVNDNAPVWQYTENRVGSSDLYSGVVSENRSIGYQVLRVYAVDLDESALYGTVRYTILTYTDDFEINVTTGYVYTAQMLDFDTFDMYNLTVEAADGGTPPRTITADIYIQVTDENDIVPYFLSNFYTETISEGTSIGEPVITLLATDSDSPELFYTITDGNELDFFRINYTTGVVYVKNKLDRETAENIDMIINVTDGFFSDTTMLRIVLTDVNDNPPMFQKSHYYTDIRENSKSGSIQLYDSDRNSTVIVAIDPDQEDTANSIVIFSTAGPYKDYLAIDTQYGDIASLSVAGGANFDYESEKTVDITLVASDSVNPPHRMSSNVTITVNVLDDNDIIPSFKLSSYSVSIFEDIPVDSVLTGVDIEAEDEDTGLGGVITYSIVSSDPILSQRDFRINSTNGDVTVIGPLDRESTPTISLTIRARDSITPFHYSDVIFQVSLDDVNDNIPTFNQSVYHVSVNEDDGSGISVHIISLNASDIDVANNAHMNFTILTHTDQFKVNQDGNVSTIKPLDHETDPMIEFVVQVCDHGIPIRLCSNATVSLTVLDINDGVPTFDYTLYNTSICNDTLSDSVVLHVFAIDTDSGSNGQVQYSLIPGSLPSYLTFYNTTGQFILVSEIPPSEVGSVYHFDIYAMDEGQPPLFSSTAVSITICDRESEVLHFNQSYYYGDLLENKEPLPVAMVMALSPFGPVSYEIAPPTNITLPFNISDDGVVSSTGSLDKEGRDQYTLIILATDAASPPNTAFTTLTVIVRDENDHPPMFLLAPYFFEITEEETGVVEIGKALAIDPDQPLAESGVRYSLDPTSNPMNTFTIDATNGSIFTVKPLDRETIDSIELRIMARDLDLQDQRVETAIAYITVLDINDNRPRFESSSYNVSVPEDTPTGIVISRVRANDSDAGEFSRITYSIDSGAEGKFTIDPNFGRVIVASGLDYEEEKFYNLTVRATDGGGLSSTAYLEVHITDINDCTPQFDRNIYSINDILESASPGLVIVDINTTDCDDGANKIVTYSITGGDSSVFHLNSSTGVITLTGSLDYEKKDSYQFEVKAMDSGSPEPLANFTQVFISISDVNDESPVFSGDPYQEIVSEDISTGFIILTAMAEDADRSTDNNRITYETVTGNEDGKFLLNADSGELSVLNSLDREDEDRYDILIRAFDNGSPTRTDYANITIIVTDVNDNKPEFIGLDTSISIRENSSNTTDIIYEVYAEDPDTVGRLMYSLSTFTNIFFIGATTGVITRSGIIDYELVKSFELPIQVTDGIHTIQETLLINIQDINDNYPLFTQSEYFADHPEASPSGTSILQVTAFDDDDSYSNKAITYYITNCTNCAFEINSTTGEITNNRPLDREQGSYYYITVLAVNDDSNLPLSTSAGVNINIIDINDHAPQFNESRYESSISELIPDGSYLLTVSATDDDQPDTPNSEIRYTIASTISNNPFSLNEETGVLLVAGSFDRETISHYNFTVEAADRGSPVSLSSSAAVIINLIDENDQPPQFTERTNTVSVREDVSSFPYNLWQLRYTDSDSDTINRDSTYHLISLMNGSTPIDYPLIQVNASSGMVMLMGPLDYEVTKTITAVLSINNTKEGVGSPCGSDGINSICPLSDTAVLTLNVNDYNDNPPVLRQSSYSSQVSTTARTGTQIVQIIATDADTQNDYGTVKYSLLAGSSLKFQINEVTGWITTRGTFTNNDGETFNIFVRAYDNSGRDPSFSVTATVRVLAISDFKRVLLLLNIPADTVTIDKEQFIANTLANLTGYNIVVEEVRGHILGDSGEIDSSKTDFIFHAVDRSTGEIVDFDVFIANLNVDEFFRLIEACEPVSITSLQVQTDNEPVETIMIFLMVLCFILIIGALVTLVLACQQRYIALRALMKNQVLDAFYGNPDPSLLEGGVMPRDFSGESFEMKGRITKNTLYTDPYFQMNPLETSGAASSVGDASSMAQDNPLYGEYADEELRVDLFQPPSDDETEGDIDEGRLLHAAIHEEEDDDDDDSATLI